MSLSQSWHSKGQVIKLKSQPQVKVSSQSSRVYVCPCLPHVYSESTTPGLPVCLNKWLVFVTRVSVCMCSFSSYCLNIVKHFEACQRGNLGATSTDESSACSQTEPDGWNFSFSLLYFCRFGLSWLDFLLNQVHIYPLQWVALWCPTSYFEFYSRGD